MNSILLLITFGAVTAFFDLKEKRIPNFLILSMLFVFFIITYPRADILTILQTLLWAFGIGFGLYYLNFWNAGDGKLLIALSLIACPLAHRYSPIPIPAIIAITSFMIGFLLFLPFFLIQILVSDPKRLVPSSSNILQFVRRLAFVLSTTWIIKTIFPSYISLSNPILYFLTYEIFSLIRGKLFHHVRGIVLFITTCFLLLGLIWASLNGKIHFFNYLFTTGFYTGIYSFVENVVIKEQTKTRIPFSPFMFLATTLICTDSLKFLLRFIHYV